MIDIKRFSVSICILSILSLNLYSEKHFIYLDLSEIKELDEVYIEIESLIRDINEGQIIFFISNGDDPFVCFSSEEVKEVFEELRGYGTPQYPVFSSDLDTISSILVSKKWLKNINTINRVINEDYKFYFYFDINQAEERKQIKYFVNKFILINRLFDVNGLIENVKVSVFLKSNGSEKDESFINKCRNEFKYYEIGKF